MTARLTSWLECSRLLERAVNESEKQGGYPPGTPAKISGGLAEVAATELEGIEENLRHRAGVAELYSKALAETRGVTFLRTADVSPIQYPIFLDSSRIRDHVKACLSAAGVPVATWYDPPIFPRGVSFAALGYDPATTPVAADRSSRVLCLPTGLFVDAQCVTSVVARLNDALRQVS
jgi:dTDP-4-amino-4,6-dideoxygalactose transaminase